MSNVKGTGVKAVYEFLKSQFGEAGLQKLRQALSPEDQKIFDKPILPMLWIDFNYYMRMIVTADKVLGKGDFKVVEEAARNNMRSNFQGIYKIFIPIVSPQFAFKQAKTIWRQFFDAGELSETWYGDKRVEMKLSHFPDLPEYHEYNLTPSMDEIIRIFGGKNTRCRHLKCALKGDGFCLWEFQWE